MPHILPVPSNLFSVLCLSKTQTSQVSVSFIKHLSLLIWELNLFVLEACLPVVLYSTSNSLSLVSFFMLILWVCCEKLYTFPHIVHISEQESYNW